MTYRSLFIVISLAPTLLNAATISALCTVAPVTISSAAPTTNFTLVCPKFDSTLGTLTSVDYSESGINFHGTANITNPTASDINLISPQIFLVNYIVHVGPFPNSAPIGSSNFPLTPNTGTIAAGATQTVNVIGPTIPLVMINASTDLAAITGIGTFSLPGTVSWVVSPQIGPITLNSFTATGNDTSPSVHFNYTESVTPTPEPSTAIALLVGLACLKFRRHRA